MKIEVTNEMISAVERTLKYSVMPIPYYKIREVIAAVLVIAERNSSACSKCGEPR